MKVRTSLFIVIFATAQISYGCTIVMVSKNGIILAGNNEDWRNPNTKMWFIPASEGEYGRICFGFDRDFGFAQGGMNDQGLFIDANAISPTGWEAEESKPRFRGAIMDTILATCATIEDVIALFKQYNVSSLARARFPVADKTGASMVVEWAQGRVQFVRKTGDYQISTNFAITNYKNRDYPCWRYKKADSLLKDEDEYSIDLIRTALSATHQEGRYPTQYSNIYDLRNGEVFLYYYYNFNKVKKFNLNEELKKGRKSYDIPSLFHD